MGLVYTDKYKPEQKEGWAKDLKFNVIKSQLSYMNNMQLSVKLVMRTQGMELSSTDFQQHNPSVVCLD